MNKFLRTFFLCMLTAVTLTVSARAAEDTLRVGLNYGGSALYSANLQNFQGSGYYLGWFDESTGDFVQAGYLEEEKISMTADGTIYILLRQPPRPGGRHGGGLPLPARRVLPHL